MKGSAQLLREVITIVLWGLFLLFLLVSPAIVIGVYRWAFR